MALNINGTTGISGVDGSVSAPAVTGTDSNTGITFPAADTIKFSTGGVERMSITNSGISGITAGITEADSWYLTSSLSGSADPIQSNLSRCSIAADGFSKLGTGMTVSSGIWTFPSTGFWTVQAQAEIELASGRASRYNQLEIQVTEDNSQFLKVARGNSWFDDYGTARVSGSSVVAIIDCVNTSNVKVKFSFAADDSQAVLVGSGSIYKTRFNFIRLSDT